MIRRWRPRKVEAIFKHPILTLERRHLEAGNDTREALVVATPDWVNIIPMLDGGRVLLVRQWRFGVEAMTLEIPGGAVDPGEEERAAAARELLEETGYRACTWRRLGQVHPNPAIQSNRTGTWLATDLERLGEAEGDGEEELELELVPLKEIPSLIGSGHITHSLVIAAFYLLGLEDS